MKTNHTHLRINPFKSFRLPAPLTFIPVLFFILMIVPISVSLYNIRVNKHLTEILQIVSWERRLKAQYILNVFNESGQVPADIQTPIHELIRNLEIMLNGGKITLPSIARPIVLPASKNIALSQELRRKLRLYKRWRDIGAQLSHLKAGSESYKNKLLEFNLILAQLELPQRAIIKIYSTTLNTQLDNILLVGLVTILLASGLGVWLSILQKKSDKALIESENRFRQIFESSPLGRALLDLESRTLQCNHALSELLGYSPEELQEQTSESITHPEDWQREQSLRTALLNQEIHSYQIQKRYRHQSGKYLWAFTTAALINDNTGKPTNIILQVQDISEQKKIIDALETSESRYRNVIESATDGIIVADMHSAVLSANNKANQIFEYEAGELIGKSLDSIIPPLYREAHHAGIDRLKQTHHSTLAGKLLEMEGLKKNGCIFPLEISLSTWENQAGEIFATAILRDVTERKTLQKERERLLQSNKNLEEFTLIASHDLQEPLRKIAFYTERFSNRESAALKEESLLDIQRLLSSVHRMQNLITDLLAYARVSPQNLRFKTLDINQILHEIELELFDEIQRSGASIQVDPIPTVEGDEGYMKNLFHNLIQNALKYRQTEVSPHIHIYGKLLANQSEQLSDTVDTPIMEIRVQDNGIGFDEKYLDRIFKVFQKLHSQAEFSGTGIGLATCKKIVELHSGQLTARSQLGQGSTFIVTLPCKQGSHR